MRELESLCIGSHGNREHVREFAITWLIGSQKMAGVGRLIRSVWPRISSAGAAGSSLSVEWSSQLPRLPARAAGGLPHQGDEPYTAEPPPVAGT